jgi:hypothetical protein
MRVTTTAGDLKVGDVLPGVGRVAEWTVVDEDGVRLTLDFATAHEVLLSRDHVVWIEKP